MVRGESLSLWPGSLPLTVSGWGQGPGARGQHGRAGCGERRHARPGTHHPPGHCWLCSGAGHVPLDMGRKSKAMIDLPDPAQCDELAHTLPEEEEEEREVVGPFCLQGNNPWMLAASAGPPARSRCCSVMRGWERLLVRPGRHCQEQLLF